jgi:hypothetical protein
MGSKTRTDVTDRTALRGRVVEMAKLLATPIDFDRLVENGVLGPGGRGAWYELLRPDLLPAHAWQQATGMRHTARGDKRRTFLKFTKRNAAAAKLYEQLTGEPFKPD